MESTVDQVKYKEHQLAEKAQNILQHQQQLHSLKERMKALKDHEPTTEKDWLSYRESIDFGKKVKQYKEEVSDLEVQIQKLCRELTALELQALKLLPVSGVPIKVSLHSDDGSTVRSFCVKHVESSSDEVLHSFEIDRL